MHAAPDWFDAMAENFPRRGTATGHLGGGSSLYCEYMAIHRAGEPSDAELVRAAQAGDVWALGLLLARYRSALLAVAIRLVGYGPDAEDAVQDACLIALRRIGDLRNPHAAGGWLRTVVRNACRMRLRSATEVPLAGLDTVLAASDAGPAQLLERHALRDWVWCALENLSPPLRLAVLLRYFTGITAYQDIADACGVPVGTVRSRLHEARGRLTRALLATADTAYGDVGALTEVRRREAEDLLAAAQRGETAALLSASWSPTVEISASDNFRGVGFGHVVEWLEQDLADGVRGRLANVVASRDLVVWEFDLLSPPGEPDHCPPAAAWLLHLRSGWVERFQLVHSGTPAGGRRRAA